MDDEPATPERETNLDPKAMSKEQYMENFPAEYKLDLDNFPKHKHNWVQRGIKMSCEGANHPHHSHFLVKR